MIPKSARPAGRKSIREQIRARSKLRARVAAAFRRIANGVSEQTARARTLAYYRSSGFEWARNLG